MRSLAAATLLALSLAAGAATAPYDEHADAQQAIRTAVDQGRAQHKPVLVVFGANWCGDCQLLDTAFKSGQTAPLIAQHYNVVKVDVGRFDRNVGIAETYGVPLKKGIPAVAVLSPEGRVVYATQDGELADARGMGDAGLHAFFSKMIDARR